MKIALIAVTGVRACNQELTASDIIMRGFLDREDVIASLHSLSLLSPLTMTAGCMEVERRRVPDLRKPDRLPDRDRASVSKFTAPVESRLGDEFGSRNIHCVGQHIREPVWPVAIVIKFGRPIASRYDDA